MVRYTKKQALLDALIAYYRAIQTGWAFVCTERLLEDMTLAELQDICSSLTEKGVKQW